MKLIYLFIPFVLIALSIPSCTSSLGNNSAGLADTVVAVQSIEDITVQYTQQDSSFDVLEYWTDETGRPIYKKSEEHFTKNQQKDGFVRKWNQQGVLIYESQWSKGIPNGYLVEYYDNGNLKHKLRYDGAKGFPYYEVYFHENGRLKTDTIIYNAGKREGSINYYDDEGKLIQSHNYVEDKLVSIEVHSTTSQDTLLAQRLEELTGRYRRLENQLRGTKMSEAETMETDSLLQDIIEELAANTTKGGREMDDGISKMATMRYLEGLLYPGKKKQTTENDSTTTE